MSFEDRIHRLHAVVSKTELREAHDLLKIAAISPVHRQRIVDGTKFFLWSCLSSHYREQNFDLAADPLVDYAELVEKLPNVTPNGLVLPKQENALAYNALHRLVSEAMRDLHIEDEVERIQFPINVRLQSGRIDGHRESRPRASTKPHSDIWAGDPAGGIMMFLSVLGDPSKVGIRFLSPSEFPTEFLRPLDDYDEGRPVVAGAKELPSRFDEKGWFIVDPFMIHETTKAGSGLRVSLDFRFIPKRRVATDWDEDEARKPFFISYADWLSVGRDRILVTEETLGGFRGGDASTRGYPVKFDVIPLSRAV